MKVADRIARLRALMEQNGIDAYIVPTADFHQSENAESLFLDLMVLMGQL